MMAFIFLLLLITVLLAWMTQRQLSLYFYIITLVISTLYFLSDLTTPLSIQL